MTLPTIAPKPPSITSSEHDQRLNDQVYGVDHHDLRRCGDIRQLKQVKA